MIENILFGVFTVDAILVLAFFAVLMLLGIILAVLKIIPDVKEAWENIMNH